MACLNNRLSLIGRAYLAFSPSPERKILLDIVASHPTEEDFDIQHVGVVNKIIKNTRRLGFSMRNSKLNPKPAQLQFL